jgi:hypothetical protein
VVFVISGKFIRFVAAGSVAVVVATSGLAIATAGSSGSTSGAATETATLITGAAANKAKAAVLAAKYSGTVSGVLKLSDGSYAVVLTGTSGPQDVFVSKSFKVTGSY